MNNKSLFIGAVVATVFTFSTVLAQNVQSDLVSEVQTLRSSDKLLGLRERGPLKGTSSTGGGGARSIPTETYPDKTKLEAALQIIAERVDQAELPRAFKSAIAEEIRILNSNDDIRVLPALVDFQRMVKGRKQPNNQKHFISLSGISAKSPGEEIILSAYEHEKKSTEEAASSILHEVLHNIVSAALTEDEIFLDNLENGIMNGKITHHLRFAIKEGIYLAHSKIDPKQFIDFLNADEIFEEGFMNIIFTGFEKSALKIPGTPSNDYYKELTSKAWALAYEKLGQKKLEETSFFEFQQLLEDAAGKFAILHYGHQVFTLRSTFFNHFKKRILEVNPQAQNSPGFNEEFYYFGCKEKGGNFFTRNCAKRVSIGEYMNISTLERYNEK